MATRWFASLTPCLLTCVNAGSLHTTIDARYVLGVFDGDGASMLGRADSLVPSTVHVLDICDGPPKVAIEIEQPRKKGNLLAAATSNA